MPEIVYVVPGLAESVLNVASPLGVLAPVVYPDVPGFLLGGFGRLRLAADGVSPGAPDGVACATTNVLGPWVGIPTLAAFESTLRAGYSLRTWPWDWRKSILTAGDALANQIAADIPAGEQCSIVGHSAGGMVARRAWSTLGAAGKQGLVRRIVTLGTPHYGTYTIVSAWSGGPTFVLTLWQWNSWGGQTVVGISTVTGYVMWSLAQVIALSQTWPSMYELMPIVGAPDAAGDPYRADLFTAANWGGLSNPSQAWLTHALTVYQPWALSPQSMPPDDVLVAVAGGYRATPAGLVFPERLGTPGGIGETQDGDDTVTRTSAQPVGSTPIRVTPDHSSLYPNAAANGDLVTWLSRSISPSPPPPPETIDPRPFSVVVDDPPPAPNPPGISVYRSAVGDC